MKRIFSALLIVFILMAVLPASAFAADTSRRYAFDLTAEGVTEYDALPGEMITVELYLRRTDTKEKSLMYGMQDEILYDDNFFRLIESSVQVADDVQWTDMARRTGGRAFYLNYVGMEGGTLWDSDMFIGSFRLEVIADKGSSTLVSDNFKVSTADGHGEFAVDLSHTGISKDVTVMLTKECNVSFDSCGGSAVESVTAEYGVTINKPADPLRDGYVFTGWYTDISKTNGWDFEKDVVTEHMTLYAGWKASAAQNDTMTDVKFDTNGGSKVSSIEVTKGEKIEKPEDPTKKGYKFTGWYSDKDLTTLWDFDNDVAQGDEMTLYAGWEAVEEGIVSPGTGDSAVIVAVAVIFVLFMIAIVIITKKRASNK